MDRRRLGRTEHLSSVAILGGQSFASATQEQAKLCLKFAVSRNVNHIDLSPSFGLAEEVVGQFLEEFRDQLFVSSKTPRRNANGLWTQLAESLKTLHIEQFDLYQAQGVTSLCELDKRGDAVDEIFKAQEQGLTRFVGLTGHGCAAPVVILEALHRYDLDVVMFPLYPRLWASQYYRRDVRALLWECTVRDVGVLVTRSLAWRPWGDQKPVLDTWYEPQSSTSGIQRGVDFALSTKGVHAFSTPGDLRLLAKVLDAAERYSQMSGGDYLAAVSTMSAEKPIFPLG